MNVPPAIPSTPSLKKSPAPSPRISPDRGAYPFTDGSAAHQGRARRGTGMRIFRGLFAAFAALALTFVILERLPAPVQRADAPLAPLKSANQPSALFARAEVSPPQAAGQAFLSVYREGALQQMELEDYILGVVAAEMPVDFEPEALKAQAVAARTYAAHQMAQNGGSGCSRHPGADICADSGHCQAYASEEALKKRWGQDYAANREKLAQAVWATRGQIMTYQGEIIEAMFHSTSGGHTEDVEQVYAQALPYLRGVVSEGEEDAPKFHSQARFSVQELNEALSGYEGARLSADEPLLDQVKILSRTESGRVGEIQVGGACLTGTQMRRALGLNSSNFTLEQQGEELLFSMTGYGHGVGMSQVGANAMAQKGRNYQEILKWYYTGVELEVL